MTLVVLSPHLDDAALSAFSRLAAGVVVVNVFDGVPEEGTLSLWDRLCGASSSAEQARERLREDADVLAPLGVRVVSCGLRDALNRVRDDPLDREETAAVLAAVLDDVPAPREVLAPLAGGPRQHPDHRLVRDAALAARDVGLVDRLELYADFPYCAKGGGWPVSLGGGRPDPRWVGRIVRETRLGSLLDADAVRLDAATRARKLAAMRGYRTQYESLDRRLRERGLVSNPELYGVEVTIPAPRPTLTG